MNSVATGQRAETVAAEFLLKRGYKILHQNWRTKYCEIDIVAAKHLKIWFIEVKYRRTNAQGSGLDYITQQKFQRMRFGAEVWVHRHQWDGDYELAAIEISGQEFAVTNFTLC